MPNLVAQALAPLAAAAVITSGGTNTMFLVLTGIAAVNVALVGTLWFVVVDLMVMTSPALSIRDWNGAEDNP